MGKNSDVDPQMVSMRIRIQLFFLNGDPETMPIHMRILPQVVHMLDNRKIFALFLFTAKPVYNVFPYS